MKIKQVQDFENEKSDDHYDHLNFSVVLLL